MWLDNAPNNLIAFEVVISNSFLLIVAWANVNQYHYTIFQHCHFQCCMSLEAVLVVTSTAVVHGANMGLTWVLSAPDEPHVGPMNDRGSPFRGYASTKHHTVNSALSSEFVSSTAFSTRSWTSSATERNNESSVFRPNVKRIIRTYPSKVLGDDAFSVWSCRKKIYKSSTLVLCEIIQS